MRNNQGFTIAELTIVLVVIGILVTMYFNMEQIFFAARVRQEALKVSRFENAVAQYFLLANAKQPPVLVSGDGMEIDKQAFFDRGLLVPSDFDAPLGSGEWKLSYGYVSAGEDQPWQKNSMIKTIGVEVYDPSSVLPCVIEKRLDDENMINGRGRLIGASWDFTEDEFADCYEITSAHDGMTYGVLVHKPRN